MQLRHVQRAGLGIEIHPINSGNERERNEYRGDDRHYLHHPIHFIALVRQIDIQHAGDRIFEAFHRIDHLNGVIVDVAEKELGRIFDERGFRSSQPANDLAERPNRFAQEDQFTLEPMDLCQSRFFRLFHQFFFQIFDAFAKLLENRKIMIHDRVQQSVHQIIGAAFSGAAFVVSYSFPDGIENIPGFFLK